MAALSLSRVNGIQKERVKGGPIGSVLPEISQMTPLVAGANRFDMSGGPGNNPLEEAEKRKRQFAIGKV